MYKKFIKFSIIGILNTLVDFCIYTGLTRFFIFWDGHKVTSAVIAFIVANINSYILNKIWTFNDKGRQYHVQYLKFFIVSIIGLLLNMMIFSFLLKIGIYDLIAKLAPIPVVLIWNFAINNLWTFALNKTRQKK